MHDATKILLGATQSSYKVVDNKKGTIAVGLGVRQKSDGTLSLAVADGEFLGISLGPTLSDVDYTNIVRAGLRVPVKLKSGETLAIGEQLGIDDATGEAGSVDTGITGVNAVVVATGMKGVEMDGTEVDVVLVDMQGGL